VAEQITGTRRRTFADIFAGFCASVAKRLPFGIPANFLGFALINGFTFGVDLLLLTVFHGWWGLPVWLSITLGYAGAFALSFVLNRTLNFRSHAPVGRQTALYVVAIAVNYVVFLLGVGGGLVELGVQYHVSRIVAGACEGVFMYCALRWVVFRER
jgi:putative flippase GtrA